MAKTLMELAESICDRVMPANTPTKLFDTNDRTARRLRMAAKDTIRDIMRSCEESGVSGFHSQWVFATKPGIYSYRMPPDYYRMIPDTEQRGRWPLGIIGPVSPSTWSNWVSGQAATVVPMGWRIKNNTIHFEPPPAQVELVVIEYLSRFMVARDATDDDLEPVDGRLTVKAPLVPRDGYIADGALDAVPTGGTKWGEATWGAAVWGETPTEALRRIPPNGEAQGFPAFQVRQEEFQSETDRCALDDDYVVELGMLWRFLRSLGKPYSQEQDDYEREKGVFLASDASKARTFSFGSNSISYETVPLGGGQWLVG